MRAACAGMSELFLPEFGGYNLERARAICADCEVSEECLAYALRIPPQQDVCVIYAGTTPQDRAVFRARQTRALGAER